MNDRYLAFHAHFYQPPREDPWTGEVHPELGAGGYANFNEKINAECYRPNAALGNLDVMSFNFGPTLLRWLESYARDTYQRILGADLWSTDWFGLGNGMAQAYNHTILPLATRRDRQTQVRWGIADFTHRFGHSPLGMWLPEMAVDCDTLQVLAETGIRFTLLSPAQATGELDPSHPYWVCLDNDQRMAVFFRREDLSNVISFQPQVTENATTFADRYLAQAVDHSNGVPPLLLMAMDGETFGHHQPLREYFLQALLYVEASRIGYTVCSPNQYLWHHPPQDEVDLAENTSWSCGHGLDRWGEGCNCTPGDSQWKRPLRRAFDQLAEDLDGVYEEAFRTQGLDPWIIRDHYIAVMLGQVTAPDFLREWTDGGLTREEEKRLLGLLAAQPSRQAMFTSCGWYWEDPSRLETRHVLGHAARAITLTAVATGVSLISDFRRNLRSARSWITDQTAEEMLDRILADHHET
jgi:alpha-amylase/alpha-mannosidase (GH57 family)